MKKLSQLSEKLSKYFIAAILIIVPLLPKFPLIKIPGIYVAIRFEDLIMFLSALLLIPKFIVDFKVIWKDKIFNAILIFFATTFLSLIAGALITQSIDIKIALLHWARRIEYIIPFLIVYLLIPRKNIKETTEFYFKILLIDVILAFLYGIGQRYFRFPMIITQNEEFSKGIALRWAPGSHINSTFAGHYDLSAFIVLVMPLFLGALFMLKGKITKIVTLASSGMGLWLLINSISRTAQASYLLAVTISLLMLKKFKAWILVVAVSLVFMFLSSGLDARFSQAIRVIYEHITAGKSFSYIPTFTIYADEVSVTVRNNATPTPAPVSKAINDVSISIRLNVEWPRALRAFYTNPLLGTGYSSIGLATDNDYLRMLGEIGILGFASFLLIFIRIGQVAIKAFKIRDKFSEFEKVYIFAFSGGIVGTFFTATLIDLFEASKFAIIFWLMLGCAVSMMINKTNEV